MSDVNISSEAGCVNEVYMAMCSCCLFCAQNSSNVYLLRDAKTVIISFFSTFSEIMQLMLYVK